MANILAKKCKGFKINKIQFRFVSEQRPYRVNAVGKTKLTYNHKYLASCLV